MNRRNLGIKLGRKSSRAPARAASQSLRRLGGIFMRAVLQRVSEASVMVEDAVVGRIGKGWLVLLGVGSGDTLEDGRYISQKILHLRAFNDEDGKMNRSVLEEHGEVLLISQFTLYGDCRSGRRPGFSAAAPPDEARNLYEAVGELLRAGGLTVATGQFQASMQVSLVNSGPVTLLVDSRKDF